MYKKALIAALISCMTVSAAGCQMNSTKTDTIPDSTADINAAPTAEPAEGESWAEPVVLVKGESTRLPLPANFKGEIRWTVTNGMKTVGGSQKKYPLSDGETDGERTAGYASAEHLLKIEPDGTITALEKGNHLFAVAEDKNGNRRIFPMEVRIFSEDQLPETSKEDFQTLRTRYVERLTGGNIDISSPAAAAMIQATDQACDNAWNSYLYKGSGCADVPWAEDLAGGDEENYKNDAAKFRKSYQKAEAMAKAYASPSSSYYKNEALLTDIVNILDWLTDNCYYPRSETDNWWNWEIGMPKNVLPAVLYIYDDIPKEQSRKFVKGVEFFMPDPFHLAVLGTASTLPSGYAPAASANLMDCAYTSVGLGLVCEDSEYLALAKQAAATTLERFQKPELKDGNYVYANGFYEDGSYIDHGTVPYTASYGIDFLKGSVRLSSLLADSPWALSPENAKMLESYVVKGYLPSIYQGAALDMLRGRAISRPDLTDRAAGQQIIEMIVQTIDIVSPETAAQIRGAIKTWVSQSGEEQFLAGVKDISVFSSLKEIMADDTIDTSSAEAAMHQVYPYMDRTIHRTTDYLFGISMYSSRISNCEIMNDENLKGWFTGFGMTYLYNDDKQQYTDHFWDTVNPLRLPGTTIVAEEVDNGEPDSSGFHQGGDFLSPENWVGGTSIGTTGVSGMKVNGTAISNGDQSNASPTVYADSFRAEKSYFMFDDEIVCLGAGIQNSGSDAPVITTVENRKLSSGGSNQISSDAGEWIMPEEQIISPQWLHLKGNTETGSDIGYYFPEKQDVHIMGSTRTGSYHQIKGDLKTEEETAERPYFTCWFDHGAAPENDTYSYVLLPDMTREETKAYSQSPDVEILENSEKLQAVNDHSTNTLAVNFWDEAGGQTDRISCDSQASVMVQENNGAFTIALSDPTMLNTGTICLKLQELPISGKLIEADDGITIRTENGSVYLEFNVNGMCGKTMRAVIQ